VTEYRESAWESVVKSGDAHRDWKLSTISGRSWRF